MNASAGVRIIVFAFYLGLPAISGAVILDFNSPAVPFQQGYGPGNAYIEEGFRFTTTNTPGGSGSIIRFNPATQLVPGPTNGTVYFGDTFDSNPVMDRTNHAAFSLGQIDLAYYSSIVLVSNITFLGNKTDGSQVTRTFELSGPFDGHFHTFQFDPSWTGLTSVDFLTDGFAWDNISATVDPVPEPTITALSTMGGSLLLVWAYRRKVLVNWRGSPVGSS